MSRTWWRNEPITGTEPLKGSTRIIYEELMDMVLKKQQASVMALAERTAYSSVTVCNALQKLKAMGMIRMYQKKRGCAARYEIVELSG